MTHLSRNVTNLMARIESELRHTPPTEEARIKQLLEIRMELQRRIKTYQALTSDVVTYYVSIPLSARQKEQMEIQNAKQEKRLPAFWPQQATVRGNGPYRFVQCPTEMGDDLEWWMCETGLAFQELDV